MTSGKFLGPGEGQSFVLKGIHVSPKVTGADNGGAYSLIEHIVPHGLGIPAHVCRDHRTAYYVVEGEFSVVLGEETKIAAAGACVIVPAGTVSSFENIGDGEGRLLVAHSPAGHERFLLGWSQLAHGDADPARMQALCDKHGVTIL
jgi:mannose-6-phosphate isomerase-like protein (cupin superfamily)